MLGGLVIRFPARREGDELCDCNCAKPLSFLEGLSEGIFVVLFHYDSRNL